MTDIVSRRVAPAALLLAMVLLSGCAAVLTPSQVKEVQTFAKAAENCAQLPPPVISAYAEALKERNLLDAAVTSNSTIADKQFRDAFTEKARHEALTEQTEASLAVLRNYGALLSELSSDEFTEATAESAIRAGKVMDKASETLSKLTGETIPQIGPIIAGVLRAGAGIYIKCRQHKAIKKAVADGGSIVRKITSRIDSLMNIYTLPPGEKTENVLLREKDKFLESFLSYAKARGPQKSHTDLRIFYDDIESVDQAVMLAQRTQKASRKLVAAHDKLQKAINQKRTLKTFIEEVQEFKEEVDAALEIKKKLESNGS